MEKFDIKEFEKEILEKNKNINIDEKNIKQHPNPRPMGIIYPKYIKRILDGEKPVINIFLNDFSEIKKSETEIEEKNEKSKIFQEIRNELNPFFCPECKKIIKDKIDLKIYRLRKKCFLCNIKEERKIKELGLWKDYENKIMTSNKIAYLKDIKEQTINYINNELKREYEIVKEDGTMEKWINNSYDDVKIFLENIIKEIDENINDLTEYLNELNQKLKNLKI